MEKIAGFNQGVDSRSVALVKFSPDDKYIYTVDKENINKLRMWEWRENKLVAETSTGEEAISDMDASDGEFKIVIVGKHRLIFYKIVEVQGKLTFESKNGSTTGSKGKTFNNDPTCVTFYKGSNKAASGTVKGEVYLWEGNIAKKSFRIHDGYVS